MIGIIDYGLGNIRAFVNVYERLNVKTKVVHSACEFDGVTRLILPGVGAFDHAMTLLNQSGMRPVIDDMALEKKLPVLGICVGMQILAASSDEGQLPGLGWNPGRVCAFSSQKQFTGLALPHMGWNDVSPIRATPLFKGLETDARFYFLHSYFFECEQPAHVISVADYGINFCCALQSENIYGVQFHPEKSHHWGVQLLKNFSEI